jgi:hypothetical protein
MTVGWRFIFGRGPEWSIDPPPLAGSPFKRRYSHKDVFRLDTTTKADRSRVQGPSLRFRSKVPDVRSFRRVLKLLDRCGFDWVWYYHGPLLGIEVDRGQLPSIELVEKRLAKLRDPDVPMGGLRARLIYKDYQGIRAKVKVGRGQRPKVRVKVKGPVHKADWHEFRRLVKKQFDVAL